MMSQKFVMLFLVSNPRVVSLEVAAKILIGEEQGANQDKNKFKSESRNRRGGAGRRLPGSTATEQSHRSQSIATDEDRSY